MVWSGVQTKICWDKSIHLVQNSCIPTLTSYHKFWLCLVPKLLNGWKKTIPWKLGTETNSNVLSNENKTRGIGMQHYAASVLFCCQFLVRYVPILTFAGEVLYSGEFLTGWKWPCKCWYRCFRKFFQTLFLLLFLRKCLNHHTKEHRRNVKPNHD